MLAGRVETGEYGVQAGRVESGEYGVLPGRVKSGDYGVLAGRVESEDYGVLAGRVETGEYAVLAGRVETGEYSMVSGRVESILYWSHLKLDAGVSNCETFAERRAGCWGNVDRLDLNVLVCKWTRSLLNRPNCPTLVADKSIQ